MPYKSYKPENVEKIKVGELDVEVNRFKDDQNVYYCGVCNEICPIEFYYINDCALCGDACKEKYLTEFEENEKNADEMEMDPQEEDE